MATNNNLEQIKTTIRVDGRGDTKQKAIADALSKVQHVALKETQNIILRIQPLDVEIINATCKVTEEKFLFFFLPRKRELYKVVMDVAVEVMLLNMQDVHFESIN